MSIVSSRRQPGCRRSHGAHHHRQRRGASGGGRRHGVRGRRGARRVSASPARSSSAAAGCAARARCSSTASRCSVASLPRPGCATSTVTTVEGIADGDALHPVQRAFAHHDGLQCGYCTPGFVVDAVAFHDRWRAEHGTDDPPDRHAIAEALAGHLCRCGAYEGIYRAVAAACRGEHDGGAGSVERVDAPAKVTGAAVYTTDVTLPGMLYAAIRRSEVAAGLVGRITFPDGTPGIDVLPDDRRVRWAGQPIAVVAAESEASARRLARELTVPLTPQAFVIDPDEAVRPGAPEVYATRAERKQAPTSGEGGTLPAPWDGNTHGPSRTTVPRHRREAAPPVGPRGGSSRTRRPRVPHRRRSCTPLSSRTPASRTGATRSGCGSGSAPRPSRRCASRSRTTSTSSPTRSRSSPSTSAAASAPSSA